MKYSLFRVFVLLSLLFFTARTNIIYESEDNAFYKFTLVIREMELKDQMMENKKFKFHLGMSESTYNPDTINTIGAIGCWQFMPKTLKHMGYNISPWAFKSDPTIFPLEMQEMVLDMKIESDIKELKSQWFRDSTEDINYIAKYVGKIHDGVKITLTGLIAACHIGGVFGTIKYLDNPKHNDASDVYGSSIRSYILKFSNYNYYIESGIKKELACLKKQNSLYRKLTLLSESSRLYMMEEHWKDMAIATTYVYQTTFTQMETQESLLRSYHSDYACNYLNTTEECYSLGVVPHLNTNILPEMVLEKSNGTTQKIGAALYILMINHALQKRVRGYFSSLSNQCGMLHSMSKYLTYSQYIGLRRLKSYPHLGVDLEIQENKLQV